MRWRIGSRRRLHLSDTGFRDGQKMKMPLVWAALVAGLLLSGCRDRDADLPAYYRTLRVPDSVLASAQARRRGGALFLEHCAICHGERGDGNGIRAEGIDPPPRDFTNPDWRAATSPRRVFFAIRQGLSGTAMPAWTSLNEEQTWDLVAYVLSLGQK